MRMNAESLGVAYVVGFFLAILGLAMDAWPMQLAAVAVLVLTFYSDTEDDNHVDPAGMAYMDRNGNPVGGPDLERL